MKLVGIENIFCCPNCREDLSDKSEFYLCHKCGLKYVKEENRIIFLNKANNVGDKKLAIFKIKEYFKKFPRFYEFCGYLLGAVSVNLTAKKFVKSLARDLKIINLGSGTKVLREDIINVDFQPLAGVDVVADARSLPFKDGSLDAVICDYILEHTDNAEVIIGEIKRVLRPGGLLYLKVPFMMAFHSAPDDFYRWTKPGLLKLVKDFEQVECKVASGPASAFVWIASEWLATLFSFNLLWLYEFWLLIFNLILAPIKLLDFIIVNFKTAVISAAGYYFIGRKK